jgi:secernin
MCDTIVALPASTEEHATLFGKNSDRERNEAQVVELVPCAEHVRGSEVRCTYISVPQARRTHGVLICRPFWMWGAEMGANELGVVIGNEAVHARTPPQEQPALLGMDLLRLGLERGTTAAEALAIIISLLERHGQGGNCGHLAPRCYHNSFIIADAAEAYVLETMGREWMAERVRTVRAISNAYSIGRHPDRISSGLIARIHDAGWSRDPVPDLAGVIADGQREAISHGRARCLRASTLLQQHCGALTVAQIIAVLRDHGAVAETDADWHPQNATGRTICMHAADGERGGQTVGSLVSELHRTSTVHWVTGTSAPCLSIFKPVLPGAGLPAHGPRPTDRYDPETLWWRHERVHRAMLADFAINLAAIREERDALEADFRARVASVMDGGSNADRARIVGECWGAACETEDRWFTELDAAAPPGEAAYRASWLDMNRLAGVAA